MEGSVLHYCELKKEGLIRALDGNRYQFQGSQIHSNKLQAGDKVDFEIEGNDAVSIYCIESPSAAPNMQRLNFIKKPSFNHHFSLTTLFLMAGFLFYPFGDTMMFTVTAIKDTGIGIFTLVLLIAQGLVFMYSGNRWLKGGGSLIVSLVYIYTMADLNHVISQINAMASSLSGVAEEVVSTTSIGIFLVICLIALLVFSISAFRKPKPKQ